MSISITASAVAWYGAIVATVSLGLGFYKVWIDRPQLKISIRKDQEILGEDSNGKFMNLEPEKTFWLFSVVNMGRQKIIIDQVGIEWNDKRGGAVISRDYSGIVQRFELGPYDSKNFTISYELLPPQRIKSVWVKDTTGKTYRKKFS